MELEADHVQTTFGEVCMNAIVLEASDTLWSFKEPCEKKKEEDWMQGSFDSNLLFQQP